MRERRRRKTKVALWSEHGRALIVGMLGARDPMTRPREYTYRQISERLKAPTGETINLSALCRLQAQLRVDEKKLEEIILRRMDFAERAAAALGLDARRAMTLNDMLQADLWDHEFDLPPIEARRILNALDALEQTTPDDEDPAPDDGIAPGELEELRRENARLKEQLALARRNAART